MYSQSDIILLNSRIGAPVYALGPTGDLIANTLSKSDIRKYHIDDLIDTKGKLTTRALAIALEIITTPRGTTCFT